MARPREYSENDARQALTTAFLKKGFDGTALPDLEAETGMGRRSLYNAFGDKRAMFLRALGDFRRNAVAIHLAPLQAEDAGLEAISEVLQNLVDTATTPQGQLGCFICNTARESIASEPDISAELTAYFERVTHDMRAALENAVRLGQLSPNTDVTNSSYLLLSSLITICVLSRARAPSEVLQGICTATIASLK